MHARYVNFHLCPDNCILIIAFFLGILLRHFIKERSQLYVLFSGVEIIVQAWERHVQEVFIVASYFFLAMLEVRARIDLPHHVFFVFSALEMEIYQFVQLVV